MTKKLKFTQGEVSRFVKGIEKAGKELERIEVDVDGKLIAIFNKDVANASNNPWDELHR